MNEPFIEAFTKSKIYELSVAISKHSLGDPQYWEPSELRRVNTAMNKTLAGIPHEPGDMPEPSDLGEFAFRVNAATKSILELEQMSEMFLAVPIRGLRIGPSDQLEMFLGHYLNLVYALQEKLKKLWESAAPFARDENCRKDLTLSLMGKAPRAAFIKKYLAPMKHVVDHRNAWIYDQRMPERDLERLSMLETFGFLSAFDGISGHERARVLETERKKLTSSLKRAYASYSAANSPKMI